jgi:hypothetical protein
VTDLAKTWTVDEPLDTRGRDFEGALVRREQTRVSCAGLSFEFRVTVDERTAAGLVVQYRLELRETAGVDDGDAIAMALVVRPVIPAVSVEKLGPWERTALRQAARKLLRTAAGRVAERG